ncbi:ead/Ea22-like family protein [Serratia marcescens]|uniref:ead/Ea22-like family protein n=1 Tax=Serratia marcescens TaxID=615 RepID=UPI0013DD5F60|nr:ead/Ea22-like family protein [Serratia marcescens]
MVQRYNPDYVMHAARFAPFARENEHGEYVKFSDYEALMSELASIRQINAQTLQVKLTMAEAIKELTARVNALAVENQALKSSVDLIASAYTEGEPVGFEIDRARHIENPATDAALAAIRDKHRAEGITFAANRLLAAFEHGFIDKPAGEVADVAKMILSAVTELPGAPEEDFTRDYSDEVIALIRAELREAK